MTSALRLLHASCVRINGKGVLLMGASGAGKSDLALRLMDRGATLVGDDYLEVQVRDGQLVAQVPDRISGKLEVRGIGLCRFPFINSATIELIVRLGEEVARFPQQVVEVLDGISIPLLHLNAYEASAPLKVELALTQGIGIA